MSYSQGGEQQAICGAVADIALGRILDIGAAHPTTFSNSRALIERGWHATLVEASPDQFLALFSEYRDNPKIELILAAVGLDWGIERFWHTEDLVGTTERAHYERWKDHAKYDGSFFVPIMPLIEILGLKPYDVITIDTEGTSALLARKLLEWHELPRVLCVEHDSDPSLEQEAVARGYRRIYRDPNNLVLAR